MSGDATFSGTDYQASAIAYVYVHILTGSKLRWLPDRDDTPTAISGETRGPGDDAQIEFSVPVRPVEMQAKRGLTRGRRLTEVFERVRDARESESDVVLVVDSKSSRPIKFALTHQLERLRAGREDELGEPAKSLLESLGEDSLQVLHRVRVIVLDPDWQPAGADAKRVVELLADNIEDQDQAEAAWNAFVADGARLCADRSRRTRHDLVDLLQHLGIKLLPPKKTRRWHDDLRHSRRLLADEEAKAALDLLGHVEAELTTGTPDGDIRYRLNQHKASASLRLGRLDDAIRFAQTALDHDPKGLYAMADLAVAYAYSGGAARALEVAERILRIYPEEPDAWLVRVQVSALLRQPIPTPPAVVAETSNFRKNWVLVCLDLGRASEAREVSAQLLAEGDRSPGILWRRVQSLLHDIDRVDPERRRVHADEIERLCSETLDESTRLSDIERARALRGRSAARRILGRPQEAREDADGALLVRPDDPEILLEAAQARAFCQDRLAALSILQHPEVADNPALLAIRAGLLVSTGEKIGARRDLVKMSMSLEASPEHDTIRLSAIDPALALDDVNLAKRLASELSESGRNSAYGYVALARISASEGDLTGAEQRYRRAIALDAAHHDELLAELAQRLVVAGQQRKAILVFEEAKVLPSEALPFFVRALVRVGNLAKARQLIDSVVGSRAAPDWALDFAAQIALSRNDPESAAQYLEELLGRDRAADNARFILAATLLELDLAERAAVHVDALMLVDALPAGDRMRLAQLLLALERPDQAIAEALQAYRESPNTPGIAKAFALTVMHSKTTPEKRLEVGPCTHVRLSDEHGESRDYLVLAENDDVPRLPNEITLEAAQGAGLVGLCVDDLFVEYEGTWMSKKWTVAVVEPAVSFAYRDILENYAARFPSQDFFSLGFRISTDASTPSDLQPLMAAVHDRERYLKTVFEVYREHVLPLEMLAGLAGISVPRSMYGLQESGGEFPLWVEWSDKQDAVASRTTATEANRVVLARTALCSVWQGGLQKAVMERFELLAPRALVHQIRRELTEAEECVRAGRRALSADGIGLEPRSVPAGDEALVRERDDLTAQLDWLREHVEILPRPLEAFDGTALPFGEMRSQLGEASHDALELAHHSDAALYADDLGLRRCAASLAVPSFSSVSLIQVLPESGGMSTGARDRMLVDLMERHYAVIPATSGVLAESLRPARSESAVKVVFAALGSPGRSLSEAANILVGAMKQEALRGVRTRSTGEIMRRGLEALASRFPRLAAAEAVELSANQHLSLLPLELAAVQGICQEIRRQSRL